MQYSSQESVRLYAHCVYSADDIVEVRTLPSKRSEYHFASELVHHVSKLLARNRKGENVYVGANPRKRRGGRASAEVAVARCLFVDFDDILTAESAYRRIRDAGLPQATLLLHSGHGIHSYWRLKGPLEDLKLWSSLQKSLIRLLGSDPVIHDPSRVMRLAGFKNCKLEPRKPCYIVRADADLKHDGKSMAKLIGLPAPLSASPKTVAQPLKYPESSVLSESSVFQAESSVIQAAQPLILSSQPTGPGQRHKRLFLLAREIAGHPKLAHASFDQLREILRQWHKKALPFIRTKEFDESWFDFREGLQRVKYPAGQGPLEKALERATSGPLPSLALRYDLLVVRTLVALCNELQRLHGNDPFYLDCRTAGQLLGIPHVTAWRYLRGLVNDQVLQLVSIGSQLSRRANEYRYLGPT